MVTRSSARAVCISCFACCLAVLSGGESLGQATADFFRQNCMNCHTIGGGRLTGPDLKDVTERAAAEGKDREWLINFMMNPREFIDSGDPYALKLLVESRNVPMPTLPGVTRQRAEYLLDLIEAESKLPESQFKGLQISDKPFTPADVENGRELFVGVKQLTAGGTSCISCHTIHDLQPLGQGRGAGLGGGRLGPDLTNVFERLKGRKSLSAWLMAPGTETMQPVFKNHPMTADEIHALVAFFESTAGKPVPEPSVSRITLMLLGLAGATALVFAFDAIWKRRFQSVRQPLVDSTPVRGH
mgnify:CR=1 FL=1